MNRRVFLKAMMSVSAARSGISSLPSERFQQASPSSKRIENGLTALSRNGGDWNRLAVTYDDMHGLFGGLTLTIRGNGKVEQKAVRVIAGETRNVARADLQKLVALLLNQKAWEQRVDERPPRPDEGRARLSIQYGPDSITIWEWYNDLTKNKRILAIRDLMQAIAWTSAL